MSDHNKEINGDQIRGLKPRIAYLWLNFLRNLRRPGKTLIVKKFIPKTNFSSATEVEAWSPGRGLAESFLISELPELLRNAGYQTLNNIKILDIGCGSGRSVELFESAGLSGSWKGLDIDDRFVERKNSSFSLSFDQCDVLAKNQGCEFDLVYTNSALEHIPNDTEFPEKTVKWLKPKGIQLHFVPAPTSLLLYLWHGWRQYSLRTLEKDFPNSYLEIYAIGGLFSSILHFSFITLWENLLRVSPRRNFAKIYKWLLYYSVKADYYIPIFPVFYAVVVYQTKPNINSN